MTDVDELLIRNAENTFTLLERALGAAEPEPEVAA